MRAMSAHKCPYCTSSEAGPRNTCVCPMCHDEETTKIRAADKRYLHKKSTETTDGRRAHLYAVTSQADSAVPWPHLTSTKLPQLPLSYNAPPARAMNTATPFSQLRDLDQRDLSELMYPDGSYVMINGQLRRVNRSTANSEPLPSLRNGFTPTSDSDLNTHRSKPESKNPSPTENRRDEDARHAKKQNSHKGDNHSNGKAHKRARGSQHQRRTHRHVSDSDSDNSDSNGDSSSSSASWTDDASFDSSCCSSDDGVESRPCPRCARKEQSRKRRAAPKNYPNDDRSGDDRNQASNSGHCHCSCHHGKSSSKQSRSPQPKHRHSKKRRGNQDRKDVHKEQSHPDRPSRPSLTIPRGDVSAEAAPSKNIPHTNGNGSPFQQVPHPPQRGKETPSSLPPVDSSSSTREAPVPAYMDPLTGAYYYYSPGPAYVPAGTQYGFPAAPGPHHPNNNTHNSPAGLPPFGPQFFGPDFVPPGYPMPGYPPVNQSVQQPFVPIGGNEFSPRDNLEASENRDGSGRKHRAVPHAAYMILLGPDGVPIAVPTNDDIGKLLLGKNAKGKRNDADVLTPLPQGHERNGRKQAALKPAKSSQTGENLRRLSNDELLSHLEQLEGNDEADELVQRVMDELRQRLFGGGPATGDKPQAARARQTLRDRLNKAVGTSDEIEAQRRAEELEAKEQELKRRALEVEAQAQREAEQQRRAREELERQQREETERLHRQQLEEADRKRKAAEEEARLKAEAERVAQEKAARDAAEREEAERQRLQREKEAEEAARVARLAAEREEAERQRRLQEKKRQEEEARLAAEREEQARQRRLQDEENERRARQAAAEEAERQRLEQERLEQQRIEDELQELFRRLVQLEAQQRDGLEDAEEQDLVFILEQQQIEMDELLEAEEAELREQAMVSLMTDEAASRASIDHQMRKSIVTILEVFDAELEELREEERERSEAADAEEAARQLKMKRDAEASRSRLIPNQLKTQTEDGRIQYVGDPYISIIEERMRERRRQEKQRQNKLQEQLERQMARQNHTPSQTTPRERSTKDSRASHSPAPSAAARPSSVAPSVSGTGVVPVLPLKQASSPYGGPMRQARSASKVASSVSSAANRKGRSPSTRSSVVPSSRSRLDSVSQLEKVADVDFTIQGHNVATPSKTRSRASSLASNRGADVAAGGRVFSRANSPRSQRGSVAPEVDDDGESSPHVTPHDGFHWP